MKTSLARGLVAGALALVLIPCLLSGVAGDQPATGPGRVVPPAALTAIVQEANKSIQDTLKEKGPDNRPANASPRQALRAHALMIALAAQNRMGKKNGEDRALATLRDVAWNLAEAANKHPLDLAEVFKLSQALDRFPNLPADPQARLVRYRLTDRFDHDDIVFQFGGCGGRKGPRLEFALFSFGRQKTPYTPADVEKLELLAYKLALIGGLLREMDDFVTVHKPERRKEWVAFAVDVQNGAWELADVARRKHFEGAKRAVHQVQTACNECHSKFRD